MPSIRLRLAGFVTVVTVSCGGGGSSGPPPPTNSMAASGGAGQSDTVLATLSTPLSVTVHDQNNSPVQGVNVTWTAPTGGKVNGSTTVVTATNASGAASATLTLGTTAGSQTATAASSGVTGSPVSFLETATPGHAFSLELSSQSGTNGPPGGTLTYSVIAKDKYGNGVAGVAIAWAATVGGGSVTPPNNATAATGIASTQHQLGPTDGHDTVTATATPSLSGSPVSIGAVIQTPPAVDTISVGPGIAFSPASVVLAAGGTVTFKWADGPHGIHFTSAPGTVPGNSATMSSGTVDYPLNTKGTYNYNCTVHGNSMTGQIVVE
jgi:plastocyanin